MEVALESLESSEERMLASKLYEIPRALTSLSLLSPEDTIYVLSLSNIDPPALYESRTRTIRFDWPPGEQRDGPQATGDTTRTIAPAKGQNNDKYCVEGVCS
jgi:hypothetical protein